MKESDRSGGCWRGFRLAGLALAVSAWFCGGSLQASPVGMIQDEGPELVLMPQVDLGPVDPEPFSDEVPPMPDSPPRWVSADPVADSGASGSHDPTPEAIWPDFNEPTPTPTPTEDLASTIGEPLVGPESPPMVPEPDDEAGEAGADSRPAVHEPIVRVYHLNYVRAADLFAMIKPFLSPEGTISPATPGDGPKADQPYEEEETGPDAGGVRLVGGFGDSASTEESDETAGVSPTILDTIVLRDHPEAIRVIDEIVARLDARPKQVLLDAVVVGVELREGQELGVNFAVIDTMASQGTNSGGNSEIHLTGGLDASRIVSAARGPAPPTRFGAGAGDRPGLVMPRFLVDQGLKYGFVSTSGTGFLRALETQHTLDVLAQPSLLVSNRQAAEIPMGRRIVPEAPGASRVTASEQSQHTTNGGQSLSIRPHVTQDGMIRLEVCPGQDPGVLNGGALPDQVTSTPTTNIMVPDGATIVIGGVFDNLDEGREGVGRGLARFRSLNPISRNREMRGGKQELLVVLTPRILSQGGAHESPPAMQPVSPLGVAGVDQESSIIAPTLLDPGVLKIKAMEASLEPASGLLDLIASDFEADGSSTTSPAPIDYGVAEMLSENDSSTAQETMASMAGADAEAIEGDERGYRPGDLTRAVIARIAERRNRAYGSEPPTITRSGAGSRFRVSGTPVARALEPPPAAAPVRDASVVPVGMAQHVVEPGEDFRSIAGRYYGSPMLHAALWSVNRHSSPAPDGLQPGMTLMLPPAEVLERVYVEAVEATVRSQSPADLPASIQPEPSRRRGLGLFRRDH